MSEMLIRIVNIETEYSNDQSPAETKSDHFKCRLCDLTFHSENMLRKHMNMKHTVEQSLNKVETVNIVHQDSDSGVSDSEFIQHVVISSRQIKNWSSTLKNI